jgi:hypothetical protein
MSKRIALLIAALALAVPADALAHRPAPIPAALARAVAYWGRPLPCHVTVRAVASLPEEDTAFTLRASCTIELNAPYWGGTLGEAYTSWTEFCQTITHEVGHLLGHGHSIDPRSVMYPRLTERNVPAPCGRRALWLGGIEDDYAHPALPASDWAGAGEMNQPVEEALP